MPFKSKPLNETSHDDILDKKSDEGDEEYTPLVQTPVEKDEDPITQINLTEVKEQVNEGVVD